MADWPLAGDGQRTVGYGATVPGATPPDGFNGVRMPVISVVNTKTVWVPVIADTGESASGIHIGTTYNTVQCRYVLDVGIAPIGSAAESETVIIAGIYFSFYKVNAAGHDILFPISIPPGMRVSGRVQSNVASGIGQIFDCIMGLHGVGGKPSSPRQVVQTLGSNLSLSGGTQLPNPSAANVVEDVWSLLGTTTSPVEEIIIGFMSRDYAFPTSNPRALLDIGIGATPASAVVLSQIPFSAHANPDGYANSFLGPLPCSIPDNTQVWARYERSGTFPIPDLVVYGIS